VKEQLIRYNHEDCAALQQVTNFLTAVCEGRGTDGRSIATPVAELRSPGGRFEKKEFFYPDLEHINQCAYSNYQRERVYLRTSPGVRQSLRRKQRAGKVRPKANEMVNCERPDRCPDCNSSKVHIFHSQPSCKFVYDLAAC
jgi:hypothetical protein